jgi:hypothetical protein
LIDLYFKNRSPELGTEGKPRKVNGKIYYAVTGETYRDLVAGSNTDAGRAARLLWRKIEDAAKMMLRYINALHDHLLQERIEEEKRLRLDAESKIIKLEEEKRGPKEYPDEWFYFATCDLMARSRAYKFGIVTKSNTPNRRVSAYECGYHEFIALDYVYIIKTRNAKAIEDAFRAIVREYLKNPHKDVVLLTIHVCRLIADALALCTDGSVTHLLEMEKNFPKMEEEPKPVYLRGDGIPHIEGDDQPIAKPVETCPKCNKEYVSKTCLSKHVLKCKGPKPSRKVRLITLKQSEEQKNDAPSQLKIELVVE